MSNIGYQDTIEYIAEECLAYCNDPSEIEADVDRYMEDLTAAVQERAAQLAKEKDWEHLIPCTFVSVWDNGQRVESKARVNRKTRKVEILENHDVDVEVCDHEVIILDGEEHPVVHESGLEGFSEDERERLYFYE